MAFNTGLRNNCKMDLISIRWNGGTIYELLGRWSNAVSKESRLSEVWSTASSNYMLKDRNIKIREDISIIFGRVTPSDYAALKNMLASDNVELRVGNGAWFPVVTQTNSITYNPARGATTTPISFKYSQLDN